MKAFPHIVQSPEWGEFKTADGRKTIRVNNIQFSLHSIPFLKWKIGYCPKINAVDINWEKLKTEAKKHGCFAVRFDVPNITKDSEAIDHAICEFEKHCKKARTDTFAKYSIFLDISKSEDELLKNMHHKTRYNIKLSQRKNVIVKEKTDDQSFAIFLKLQREAAKRHKFFIHPDAYYKKLWQVLRAKGLCHLLIAYYEAPPFFKNGRAKPSVAPLCQRLCGAKEGDNEPLVAWLVFTYKDVLYYPYGGSSLKHKNLMASNLLAWEAIRLGKKLGCTLFDMWGACEPDDKQNPWWGFTKFKLGYAGNLVKFIPSYDFVIEPVKYRLFVTAYEVFWKVIKFMKV